MNVYALDNNEKVLYAGHADKHKNYMCLECAQIVRLRSGFHRQPHFYHLQPNHKCRLNGKSMQHLMLQHHLETILPKGEVQLEYRFPMIKRIADVAWIKEKIIFEIQCSPISAAEVLQRNADYASQGFQVVWLLHQARYNQLRVTAAEDVLQHFPHFFSNMNSEGKGEIYDQLSFIVQGIRKQRIPKVLIDVSHPLRAIQITDRPLPQIIKQRLKSWPLSFQGDYINLCDEKIDNRDLFEIFINEILEAEQQWESKNNQQEIWELSLFAFVKKVYVRWIAFPYRSILRLFLEKASR